MASWGRFIAKYWGVGGTNYYKFGRNANVGTLDVPIWDG
jgi:hypothetical protein